MSEVLFMCKNKSTNYKKTGTAQNKLENTERVGEGKVHVL